MVDSGLVMAWRLAICPTSRSPPSVNATIEGVVREPSLFGMTTASPPSITETQLFVVPRSMPMTFPIFVPPLRRPVRPRGWSRRRLHGDAHHRRAHEPIVQLEPAGVLDDDRPGRLVPRRDLHQRLVER